MPEMFSTLVNIYFHHNTVNVNARLCKFKNNLGVVTFMEFLNYHLN